MKATIWKYFKILNYILFIGLLCFFLYKAFLAYQLGKPEKQDQVSMTLGKYINNLKMGIKKTKNSIYFYGNNVNNTVLYNGRLWQIIKKVNNDVYMITKDNQTSITWGEEIAYKQSQIDGWLNHDIYYDTITDLSSLRSNFEMTLATVNDYKNTGSELSFMNNNTFFYLMNSNNELNYVDVLGKLQTTSDTTLGLGVRPVIIVRDNSIITSGDGSLNSPLIIGKDPTITERPISNAFVGSYVQYNGSLWQINAIDNSVKLVAASPIIKDKKVIKSKYGTNNKFDDSLLIDLLKGYDNENLVEWNYYIDNYGLGSNYSYKLKELSDNKIKVGLLGVGEIFATNISEDYFLITKGDSEQMIMSVKNNGVLFADKVDSQLAVRPVIKLNIDTKVKEGLGTIKSPYLID